jgi:malate dehydrogenase
MIAIIGAGKVGSTAAYNILQRRISEEVILLDIAENLAKGEALDMMQTAPAIEFDGKIIGTSDYSQIENSELVIITAGQPRQPGMTRIDLAAKNAKIIQGITQQIVNHAPNSLIMMVTNPVDIMTYVATKTSGFPRNRVFGMGNILDTMRFRTYIATALNVSREDIRALVIGEHGDTMLPLISYASVSGIPITQLLNKQQITQITEQTRTSGSDVIKLKGSTTYAPAAAIAIMTDAVLKDRNRLVSTSTLLQGEYGYTDIAIGVPCILGKNGIRKIIQLSLDEETKREFQKSADTITETTGKTEETLNNA